MFWKAPEDDGNDEIIEYILEFRETIQVNWTQITQIDDTSYKVDKLRSDTEYVFRVFAVNSVGASPPSPVSEFIRLTAPFDKEEPSILEPLTDRFVSLKEKVVLSSLIGGVPEPTITWYRNEEIIETEHITYENRLTKYIIEETTIETEAEYKCVATNEVGKAETKCKIIVQEKPTIQIDDKLIQQKLRKGTVYRVPAKITGFPEPEIVWRKDTIEITSDERIKITYENGISTLEITTLERTDSAKYTIEVRNRAGHASENVNLKVIDKPERPTALDIKEVKKDAVVIEWTPPVDDGGLEITKYSIEKCDPEKLVWIKVAEVDKSIITYCVQKLLANAMYIFRIIAENPIGVSEPIESDPVTIKVKIDVPSPPRAPINVSGMADDSLVLSWLAPENDGGSKIIDYIVEVRETTTEKWTKVGATNGNRTNILVKNLRKDTTYKFKIRAQNEAGISLPLLPDEEIVAGGEQSKQFGSNDIVFVVKNWDLLIRLINVYRFQKKISSTFTTAKSDSNNH